MKDVELLKIIEISNNERCGITENKSTEMQLNYAHS